MVDENDNCEVCELACTDENMVQCDTCDKWWHYECVGVDDEIAEKEWKCHSCGGKAFPPRRTKLTDSKKALEEPTMSELLEMMRSQQEREKRLWEKLEQQKTQLEKMTLDNEKLKSKLNSNEAKKEEVKEIPKLADRDLLQRILDVEAKLASKEKETQSLPLQGAESKLDQLAVLMKQAHVEDLPKFSGNTKDWPLFQAIFKRTTHIASIDNITNVGRLNKALQGEARRLVLDHLTYGHDPKLIMETLEERYAKKSDVLRMLSVELINFPVIGGPKDPKLQDFSIALKTYVAQLKALNYERELKNSLLESMLHEKLVNLPSMYRRWAVKKQADDELGINDFAEFVMNEWRNLPRCPDASSAGGFKGKSKNVNVHAASDATKTQACFYCGGNHELQNCLKFKKLDISKRWEFVKKERICYLCIGSRAHRSPDCPANKPCGEADCQLFHHRLLHWKPRQPRLNAYASDFQPGTSAENGTVSNPERQHNLSHQAHSGDSIVTAKVVAVRIFGADGIYVDDYAFLDDGSTLTMMDRKIAERLGLQGENEKLHLRWTKGINRTEDALKCDVTLAGLKGKKRFTLKDVYCVPNLDLAAATQEGSELTKRYRHLKDLPLPDFQNVKPGILIGLEHSNFLGGRRVIEGKINEPLAARTRLGWIVYGRHDNATVGATSTTVGRQGFQQTHVRLAKCDSEADRELHDLVKTFFAVESIGVSARQLRSAEDERALNVMNATLKFSSGRYEVGLIWKDDDVTLPDNSKMAMRRLISEERKLKKDRESLEWMNQHVAKLVEKNYARESTKEDLMTNWKRTWLCPMFIVVNRNKVPPKRRCVADVAATEKGVSLNSCLLKGPDNLIALPAALCRAREYPVMVTADVAEMFHQYRIMPEDQQCQRFLWRNGDQSVPPKTYIMQRMMFGPTCSPFVAQHGKNVHAEKYLAEFPKAAEALKKFMYMDDYFNSHETVEEAVRVTKDAIKICGDMGFDLIQVQSNDKKVLEQIPQQNLKETPVDLNLQDSSALVTKLLGMFWKPTEDVFVFLRKFKELEKKMTEENYRPTKREVLSTLMKFFDPMGAAAKYIVRGKWLLQDIWREKLEWDEKLPENLANEWLKFLAAFDQIEDVKIPRWYGGIELDRRETELVIFVDASNKAYAAVGYFRFPLQQPVQVALVMAKTKVAPVKTMSIPRLELEAAKLGARLAFSIEKLHTLQITRRFFLSDSRCVLSWIHSKRFDFVPFVAHRVSEILELTAPQEWIYVPTEENVADEATKITPEPNDAGGSRWFQGPDFLRLSTDQWPTSEFNEVATIGDVSVHHRRPTDPKLDEHFISRIGAKFRNNWRSLVRVTAYLLRGVWSFKTAERFTTEFLTVKELEDAEREIFHSIQREAFPELWEQLETTEAGIIAEKTLTVGSRAFLVVRKSGEKLLRLTTRDRTSKNSFGAKNPILLPSKHELVSLFLQHLHEKNFHMGIEGTIADARERVWIIAVRQALRSVIARCQWCKNRKAKPAVPTMGNLHESRTATDQKPFSFVGVDCFGPMTVREKRSDVKRWGVLFTCLTYRAIHLEVVNDLTADQMLLAVRRMIARRGPVSIMYSDNGTNFVGTRKITRDEHLEVQRALGKTAAESLKLEWKFIPAYSPWMGGAWERLIGYVKKCINFCLAGETPSDSVLANVLIEAEMMANKRPLTHTPIDIDDEEPLTPNLALFGTSDVSQAACPEDNANRFAKLGRKRVAHLVQKFRRRWEKEYLPVIARKDQSLPKQRRVTIGDVVLVTEGEANRDRWKLGRIAFIHPTSDGVPRIVDVKMGSGDIKYNRAVGNLAVLEVNSSSSH